MERDLERLKAVIFGHAVGDALGVPVEFCSRAELDADPVDCMRGFGAYPYAAGAWSDDTSMTLCALDSLAKGAVDWDEIMHNFGAWITDGAYTAVGECFDAGRTCIRALQNYFARHTPALESGETDENSNGNGSLMRILPFVLYAEYTAKEDDWLSFIHQASAMTHAHPRAKIGCGIYACVVRCLLKDPSMEAVRRGLEDAKRAYGKEAELCSYARIFTPEFKALKREEIRSTGYVVDTLEAALWCLRTTESYEACVLKAVNLGEDTDTVAAVAGGMAGALYGYDSIPKEWLGVLMEREYIEDMCERAYYQWCGM